MRHEQIAARDSYSRVEAPAVWPSSEILAPAPVPDVDPERLVLPTPAAPDVPAAVAGMLAASYAALIGAFALATVGSGRSIFAMVISALFVAIYFAVPRIFFAVEPKGKPRPALDRFIREGMDTLTGRCTGGAALVQMLIVPLSLTLAILVIGVAAAFIF